MLKSLYISSFVIIDEMHIDFHEGMSVLTGETGAGKSIIIDALGQLCGQRSSTQFVRKGQSKAIVEGIFDVQVTPDLQNICDELHIQIDDEIVITKEILKSGKSQVKINYQSSSNNALKLLTPFLLDIHSQFETQKIFEEKNHLLLLDEYAFQELTQYKEQYQKEYYEYIDLKQQLENAIEEDMSDEQQEFLESQLNEIDEYTYTDDEIDEFEKEIKIMQNFEKMSHSIESFDQLLSSSSGALSLIKEALSQLQSSNFDGDFDECYDSIYNLYYNLMDEYENVMEIYRDFHFDEYRFNELQDILFKVNRLKRKYGLTMERIMEYREELIEKIEIINNRDEYIQDLESQIKQKKEKCLSLAQTMHTIRIKYANQFEEDIQQELKDLYLPKAKFHIHIQQQELNKNGIDQIRFMVAINQGQNLSLLNETASGGEISRIMLAIKTIILKYQNIDTIIFDEVDTGVSGKVASGIGEKMKSLSRYKQVICITHLPQVACVAQHHYAIVKKSDSDQTITSIHYLKEEERIEEIAKMLSGEQLTKQAIDNAKQLLNV